MSINRIMGTGPIVLPEPSPTFGGTYTAAMGASELTSGRWKMGLANGLNWTDGIMIGGIAYGTQTGEAPGSGKPNYDDSMCIVTGCWGVNCAVTGTIKTINQDSTSLNELALWLRADVTAQSVTGYEVGFSVRSSGYYLGVTRWNGPLNNFTSGVDGGTWTATHLADGDTIFAQIVGNTITAKINGVTIGTCDVSATPGANFTTGNPGMGIWRNNNGVGTVNQTDFGWRTWSATGY